MSIIKNKDIYDPSQGDPLKPLYDMLTKLDSKIEATKGKMNTLEKAVKDVNKTGSGAEAKALIDNTQKLQIETGKLNNLQGARTKIDQALKVNQEILNRQTKENIKLKSALTGAYEKESIRLNQLRRAYKDLAAEEKGATKEGQALLRQITVLDKKLKDIDASAGQFQRSVGNYEKALHGLSSELLSAGGITLGVAGAVQAFQNFEKRASELSTLTSKITNQFGITGKSAQDLSSTIHALSNNFGKDYNEVLTAANAVSKALGISLGEALSNIEEGFKKGSDNSGQFLDILKEYPTQFKAAGLDAKGMFALINQQVRTGIYSDKGVDTIKEGGLRLRENTKAVQEALRPLDESIKKQIKQEIAAGNSFKAIQLVSKALSDTSLTAQQTQTIIADVFGGPGEDAGLDYIKTLKDIRLNLVDVKEQSSLVSDANMELSKTYNDFVQSVASSDGIISKAWAGVLDYADSYLKNLLLINDSQTTFKDRLISIMDALVPILDPLKKLLGLQKEVNKDLKIGTIETLNSSAAWVKHQMSLQKDNDTTKIKIKLSKEELEALEKLKKKRDELIEKQNEQYIKDIQYNGARAAYIKELDKQALDLYKAERQEDKDLKDEKIKNMEDLLNARTEVYLMDEERLQEYKDKQIAATKEIAEAAGQAFGELLASGEMSYKEFGKFILKTALDIAEKMLLLAIAEIWFKNATTFVGIAKAAILTGLVKGVFAGIKAQVQNFADGTERVTGPGTETSDSVRANLSVNERVLNAQQNKPLLRLGIPNKAVTPLVMNGLQMMSLAPLLNTIAHNTQQTTKYLQHGRNDWNEDGFRYSQDWQTGTIKRRRLND
jgi:hypothetical protein